MSIYIRKATIIELDDIFIVVQAAKTKMYVSITQNINNMNMWQ